MWLLLTYIKWLAFSETQSTVSTREQYVTVSNSKKRYNYEHFYSFTVTIRVNVQSVLCGLYAIPQPLSMTHLSLADWTLANWHISTSAFFDITIKL